MKAGRIHAFGGPEQIRVDEVPVPAPGPGEVRVRLRAAALNRADVTVRKGLFAERDRQQALPLILGVEGGGDIEEVGQGVPESRIGERVALLPMLTCGECVSCRTGAVSECPTLRILGEHLDGTYAESVVVPLRNAISVPDRLSYEQSAVSIVAYMTAWHMLKTRGRLRSGETVLIVGAGSGVASAAVQVAKALGATVIATTGTDAKCERVRSIGAAEAINYRAVPEFDAAVRELTDGRGVDLVHDTVGAATFQMSVNSVRHGGRVIGMGSHTGRTAELSLWTIERNEIEIRGAHTAHRGEIDEFMPLLADGSIVPIIDSSFDLTDVAAAHRRLVDDERFGKVVLTIPDGSRL